MTAVTSTPVCSTCEARKKSIFCQLADELTESLNVAKETSFYRKGQTLFTEGQRPRGIFCIHSGKVKGVQTGDEGREQILHLSKAGDVLGYRALLAGDAYSCTAIAIEDSRICFIPKDDFLHVAENNATLALEIIRLLSAELRSAEKNITDIAQKQVRGRLAEALFFIKDTYGLEEDGKTLNARFSREELANIVGTATETVIRLLSEFKNDGTIAVSGRSISILNEGRLKQLAS